MESDLASAVEVFFIERYRTHPALRGKTIVHFDEAREAQNNCIMVKATEGKHYNPGDPDIPEKIPPVPRDRAGNKTDFFEVNVEVKYRAPQKATAAHNQLVADAMTAAIFQTGRGTTKAEDSFGFLRLLDPLTSDRDHTESLRRITKTFTVAAKLRGEPVNVLAY